MTVGVKRLSLRAIFGDPAFLRFLAVGVLNTAFGYGVYLVMIFLGLSLSLSLLVASVLGVLFNFRTTGVLVFGNRDKRLLWRFVLVYVGSYAFNLGLLELLCRGFGLGPRIGQALSLPAVVMVTFVAMRSCVWGSPSDSWNL